MTALVLHEHLLHLLDGFPDFLDRIKKQAEVMPEFNKSEIATLEETKNAVLEQIAILKNEDDKQIDIVKYISVLTSIESSVKKLTNNNFAQQSQYWKIQSHGPLKFFMNYCWQLRNEINPAKKISVEEAIELSFWTVNAKMQGIDGFTYIPALLERPLEDDYRYTERKFKDIAAFAVKHLAGVIILQEQWANPMFLVSLGMCVAAIHGLPVHPPVGPESMFSGQVLAGSPSARIMPMESKMALGRYLRGALGMENPKLRLMHFPESAVYAVEINILEEKPYGQERMNGILGKIPWFLPPAISVILATTTDQSKLAESFKNIDVLPDMH